MSSVRIALWIDGIQLGFKLSQYEKDKLMDIAIKTKQALQGIGRSKLKRISDSTALKNGIVLPVVEACDNGVDLEGQDLEMILYFFRDNKEAYQKYVEGKQAFG